MMMRGRENTTNVKADYNGLEGLDELKSKWELLISRQLHMLGEP